MALPLANNAAGGSDGTTVTTGNSGGTSGDAWSAVSIPTNGSLTYSNVQATGSSALSYRHVYPTTSGFAPNVQWQSAVVGTLTEFWGRIYTYRTSLNTVETQNIALISSTGSRRMQIVITTGGILRSVNSANAVVASSSVAVPLNEWIRVEWHYVASATVGRAEVWYYHGHDTAEIQALAVGTNANTGTDCNQVEFGGSGAASTSGFGPWWFAATALSATGAIGPDSGSSTQVAPAGAATASGTAPVLLNSPFVNVTVR